MATRSQCVQAAMSGGLDHSEAERVVDDLLADRAAVEAARAQGRIVNTDEALSQAWAQRMADEQIQNAVARKQAALNVLVRQQNDARIAAVKEAGFTGMDAVEAILVGSNKRFFGARDSVDARRVSIKKDFMGGLINELETLDSQGATLKQLFEGDDAFNRNVVREILLPGGTKDETARAVADVFSRHMEKTRRRLNEAGANIGRLDGYVPQSHDPWKLAQKRNDGQTARQAWVNSVRDKLDLERSFQSVTDTAEINTILNRVYDNITLGKMQGPTALERGEYAGPANMANRLGEHRVLHFRDADSFMAYNAEYGRGNVLTGVLGHMDGAARKLSLMETLGPNPETMLKSLIAQESRLLREASAGMDLAPEHVQALKDLQTAENLRHGKVAAWWSELTGESGWPANPSAARFMAIARATQSLSKLGGASLSAVADVFVKAMNMRVQGLSWVESISGSIGQYFKSYSGQEKMIARQLGAFVDDVAGEMRARWDMNESLPGTLANIQDKFFRWSGLNWITETGKAGYATWFSSHIGEVSGKAWNELDAPRRATLEYHGFDDRRWEIVRQMTEQAPDGRTLIVPSRADDISDAALRAYLSDEVAGIARRYAKDPETAARAESTLFDRARRDLRTDVMGMISDETQYAIIEPDAKTRAFMRQGTRPGTLAGEFWRTVMQFKSFPIAYMQREMGGRRWIRGDLQEGMRYGWNLGALKDAATYDPRGVVGASISAFAFGYLAMTLKDMARGKTPRDPLKKETIFAALMQSGGAGILGDFFFNKVNRFGGDFAGTLAGPLLGDVGRATAAFSEMLRGDFKQGGEDALRVIMDNSPYINLWYTREALNWLALYHIREALSPGTLARTERKMREEYGQVYMRSPAQNIMRGGWRNGLNDWK